MKAVVPPLALALVPLLTMTACGDPVRKVSENSLLNATARGTTDELHGIGYTVRKGMRCRTLSADTLSVVRVRCVGRTDRDEPVRVDAVAYQANSPHPHQEYVITVSGREVVRRPCLGQGCQDPA
ncbi:MAG: hypothetical protein ACJ72W_28390 [Actinoallomurus sp.]